MSEASPSSFYFASRRPRTGSVSVSNEIEHLTPRQERSLAKQQSKSKTSSYQAEDAIIEHLPTGAKREDFLNFSRPIIQNRSPFRAEEYVEQQKVAPNKGEDPPIGSYILPRAVPIKIEPKVFFAAERTFLLWMHSSLWLIAGSMTILAYAKDDPQKILYGATIFPVGIVFIIYALYQFMRRVKLLQVKHPGPYEDINGPVVLSIILMLSIVAQFGLKVYNTVGFPFGS